MMSITVETRHAHARNSRVHQGGPFTFSLLLLLLLPLPPIYSSTSLTQNGTRREKVEGGKHSSASVRVCVCVGQKEKKRKSKFLTLQVAKEHANFSLPFFFFLLHALRRRRRDDGERDFSLPTLQGCCNKSSTDPSKPSPTRSLALLFSGFYLLE